jgi:hypothetical protein
LPSPPPSHSVLCLWSSLCFLAQTYCHRLPTASPLLLPLFLVASPFCFDTGPHPGFLSSSLYILPPSGRPLDVYTPLTEPHRPVSPGWSRHATIWPHSVFPPPLLPAALSPVGTEGISLARPVYVRISDIGLCLFFLTHFRRFFLYIGTDLLTPSRGKGPDHIYPTLAPCPPCRPCRSTTRH